jgi:hypothetical protein
MNITTIAMYAVLAVLVVLYMGRRRNRLNQED